MIRNEEDHFLQSSEVAGPVKDGLRCRMTYLSVMIIRERGSFVSFSHSGATSFTRTLFFILFILPPQHVMSGMLGDMLMFNQGTAAMYVVIAELRQQP